MKSQFAKHKAVVGIIGHPVKHSLSPLMQNTAFERMNLDYIYLPFDVLSENLEDAMKGIVALGIKGFNVTIPHKEKIIQYLNNISDEANIIGAVNTVVNENGTLTGYNTDVNGILKTLEPFKDELEDSEVSIFGAGGVVRSILYALIGNFKIKKINLINRTKERAEFLKDYYSEKMLFRNISTFELMPPDLTKVISKSKLLINGTPLGMFPDTDDSPLLISNFFNENQIVFDVVYNPLKTKFLALAESAGARTLNGLKMFVEQGSKSFELWTSEQMPTDLVTEVIRQELEKQ
jgi:shikimate dehydrogenase